VIGHNVVVVGERHLTNRTLLILFDNFAVEQPPHLRPSCRCGTVRFQHMFEGPQHKHRQPTPASDATLLSISPHDHQLLHNPPA
jgi:hypothetical protein